jgi:hypothetical protein
MDWRCRFTGARSVAQIFLRRRQVTAAVHGVCEHLRRRGVEKRRRRGYCFLLHPSDAVDSNTNGFVIISTQNAPSEKLLYTAGDLRRQLHALGPGLDISNTVAGVANCPRTPSSRPKPSFFSTTAEDWTGVTPVYLYN